MTTASTTEIITGAFTTYGGAVLTILTAVIGIGLAYLVFKFGWRKIRGAVR